LRNHRVTKYHTSHARQVQIDTCRRRASRAKLEEGTNQNA
jgi:hypothetical protein